MLRRSTVERKIVNDFPEIERGKLDKSPPKRENVSPKLDSEERAKLVRKAREKYYRKFAIHKIIILFLESNKEISVPQPANFICNRFLLFLVD